MSLTTRVTEVRKEDNPAEESLASENETGQLDETKVTWVKDLEEWLQSIADFFAYFFCCGCCYSDAEEDLPPFDHKVEVIAVNPIPNQLIVEPGDPKIIPKTTPPAESEMTSSSEDEGKEELRNLLEESTQRVLLAKEKLVQAQEEVERLEVSLSECEKERKNLTEAQEEENLCKENLQVTNDNVSKQLTVLARETSHVEGIKKTISKIESIRKIESIYLSRILGFDGYIKKLDKQIEEMTRQQEILKLSGVPHRFSDEPDQVNIIAEEEKAHAAAEAARIIKEEQRAKMLKTANAIQAQQSIQEPEKVEEVFIPNTPKKAENELLEAVAKNRLERYEAILDKQEKKIDNEKDKDSTSSTEENESSDMKFLAKEAQRIKSLKALGIESDLVYEINELEEQDDEPIDSNLEFLRLAMQKSFNTIKKMGEKEVGVVINPQYFVRLFYMNLFEQAEEQKSMRKLDEIAAFLVNNRAEVQEELAIVLSKDRIESSNNRVRARFEKEIRETFFGAGFYAFLGQAFTDQDVIAIKSFITSVERSGIETQEQRKLLAFMLRKFVKAMRKPYEYAVSHDILLPDVKGWDLGLDDVKLTMAFVKELKEKYYIMDAETADALSMSDIDERLMVPFCDIDEFLENEDAETPYSFDSANNEDGMTVNAFKEETEAEWMITLDFLEKLAGLRLIQQTLAKEGPYCVWGNIKELGTILEALRENYGTIFVPLESQDSNPVIAGEYKKQEVPDCFDPAKKEEMYVHWLNPLLQNGFNLFYQRCFDEAERRKYNPEECELYFQANFKEFEKILYGKFVIIIDPEQTDQQKAENKQWVAQIDAVYEQKAQQL